VHTLDWITSFLSGFGIIGSPADYLEEETLCTAQPFSSLSLHPCSVAERDIKDSMGQMLDIFIARARLSKLKQIVMNICAN
jgi:hypothetical protein